MGKIIFFDDERKRSNNKNLRMKQMTAVDMVRASQATLSKATVWKTRRIHLFSFVFVRKKWKLEADCSSLENPGAPLWKLTVEKWKLDCLLLRTDQGEHPGAPLGNPLRKMPFLHLVGFKQNWFQYRNPMQFKVIFPVPGQFLYDCMEIQQCSWLLKKTIWKGLEWCLRLWNSSIIIY